ncbi:palmitoyltransferase ZDHHC21 isoform X3 [Cricetulus griseus]|uniref:Palmitoyltransferase n=1 Tax=Cricetulus griseus TaxID=10029 RepID=A0A9J7FFI7_CRIGR|nr:palmitoyltransferase ZDHHC21 isoform X3 [Cricetulus griseus]XP_027256004.1 palmitoyltransferase ZDHHC21 isoform X3 [Cricetulus griseus]
MGLRIHFVVDPHGWCCMGLIVFVWLYNIVLIPKIVLFPHYEEGHIPGILIIIFYGISIFCLVALVRASLTDPGRLPENPKIPHAERELWELCNKCNLMRPKRSHHCSRCGHCVRRMDHHCPWINNCVGEDNHWLFLQLCFYTELLTCYALMFSFCHYYYFLPLKKRNLDLFVVRHELAIMRLAAFMGITMLVGITGLFYTQLIGIITLVYRLHLWIPFHHIRMHTSLHCELVVNLKITFKQWRSDSALSHSTEVIFLFPILVSPMSKRVFGKKGYHFLTENWSFIA